MKPYITLIFFLVMGSMVNAQQIEVQIDIVSQNIWRGMYVAGASIQPLIIATKGNFELTVWNSIALHENEYEVDAILSYSLGDFSVGLTDYWNNTIQPGYSKGHLLEFNMGYEFPKIPLTVEWNTALDSQCCSYAEINYCKPISDVEVSFSIGLTPWENKMLETDGFAFSKIAIGISKELNSTNIPIKPLCSFIYNPIADQLFVVAEIKFSF